jgi:hypothetical protein
MAIFGGGSEAGHSGSRFDLSARRVGSNLNYRQFMRTQKSLSLAALLLLTLNGHGQEATVEERAFFEKNIARLVKVEPKPISGQALERVFGAKFYTVSVSMGGEQGMKSLVAARVQDELKDVSLPEINADLPALKSLVKPDFKLKGDAAGKVFEEALDLLYPVDVRYDEKRKAVRHVGAEWLFIRGTFIADFKGLVVTTDADGTIRSIKYSREIK